MNLSNLFAIMHTDSWRNLVSGMGTGRDKSSATMFTRTTMLADEEITALFACNSIAKKIVRTLPRMVRSAGHSVAVLDAEGKEDADATRAVRDEAKRLGLEEVLYEGMLWGRCFGGAALLVMNGKALDKPVDLRDPGALASLLVFDRRYLRVSSTHTAGDSPNYGKPEWYELHSEPLLRGPDSDAKRELQPGTRIHASRIIRFMGDEVDRTEQANANYWSYSVLQTVYDNLKNGDSAVQSLGALLAEASVSVFKVRGLVAAQSSNERDRVMERMSFADTAKSLFRSIIIDAEREEYGRVDASMTGAADTAMVVLQHVAAAAETPMTVLFGISPAGMNATGESDLKNWYSRAGEWRTDEAAPRYQAAYDLIAASLGYTDHSVSITWGAFYAMTPTEEAALAKATAEVDKAYIDMLALLPESVAMARFGSGKLDLRATPSVDVEALQQALKPQPLDESAPAVDLTPSAFESVITMRMVFNMIKQPLPAGFPEEDLDLSIAAKRAKDEAAAAASAEAPALPAAVPGEPGAPILPPSTPST